MAQIHLHAESGDYAPVVLLLKEPGPVQKGPDALRLRGPVGRGAFLGEGLEEKEEVQKVRHHGPLPALQRLHHPRHLFWA